MQAAAHPERDRRPQWAPVHYEGHRVRWVARVDYGPVELWPWLIIFCSLPVSSVLHAPHAPLGVGTDIVVVPADRSVTPENPAAIGPAVCAPQGYKGYRTTHTHTDYLAEIFFPPAYQREVMPINGISFTFTC